MIISTDTIVHLISEQLMLVLVLSLPVVATIAVAAILISLVQAVTQVQEQTIQFLVKVLTFGLMMAMVGHWMLQSIISYTQEIMLQI